MWVRYEDWSRGYGGHMKRNSLSRSKILNKKKKANSVMTHTHHFFLYKKNPPLASPTSQIQPQQEEEEKRLKISKSFAFCVKF